jgi:hypothetical protein
VWAAPLSDGPSNCRDTHCSCSFYVQNVCIVPVCLFPTSMVHPPTLPIKRLDEMPEARCKMGGTIVWGVGIQLKSHVIPRDKA